MHSEWRESLYSVWDLIASDGAPAWVQAIGSIMALFIAIRVSRLSIEHAGVLRQKNIFFIAEAVHEYSNKIRTAIESISDEPGSNVELYNVYHPDVTASMVKALQGVPVHELGSGQQVLAILGLSNQLVFLGNATDKLMVPPSTLPELSSVLDAVGNDHEERRRVFSSVSRVLKRNALNHLDKIDEHYEVLKKTIPS
ncbi:TPA: hypothetical protein ACKP22_000959 [Pseudomonas putida]